MTGRKAGTKVSKDAVKRVENIVRALPPDNIVKTTKQERFDSETVSEMFWSVYNWALESIFQVPIYAANSRERDAWLQMAWQKEPYLAGVLNSITSIDKNRGWSLIGGRNQVAMYSSILHNFLVAPDLMGWRHGIAYTSLAYNTSDLGGVVEIGRDGKGGPMRGLFTVDPALCRLTGNIKKPLKYKAYRSKEQIWANGDYFRVVSMPSTSEAMNGLGFCALSRMLRLAQTMVAVYEHDNEKLGARAQKGILLLNGIDQLQFETSLKARKQELDSVGREYYGGVQILASSNASDGINAQLIGLSQLPDGFDKKTFVDLLMYGYALCVGYDPREFWPVSGGSLGTATETETQHKKATGKGGLDFINNFQEQLQLELPQSIQFEFEQRDADGKLMDAEVNQALITNVTALYNAGIQQGLPLLDREQCMILLAEAGVIPHEWTQFEEDVEATDQDDEARSIIENKDKLLESLYVQRAIEYFPDEPLVKYIEKRDKGRFITLFEHAKDALSTRRYSIRKRDGKSRKTSDVLYKDEDTDLTITNKDVTKAIDTARRRTGDMFADMLEAKGR